MEDFKFLIYIFGAIIFLVLRMWRKAFKAPAQTDARRLPTPPIASQPVPRPPATSFDDILKEMKASGERAKKAVAAPSLEKSYPPEITSREAKSLERTETPAYSLETRSAPTKVISKKLSAIELARQPKPKMVNAVIPAVNYNRLLHNPQNVRTAFILSEILTRRFDY